MSKANKTGKAANLQQCNFDNNKQEISTIVTGSGQCSMESNEHDTRALKSQR